MTKIKNADNGSIIKFTVPKIGGKYNWTPKFEPVNKQTIDGNDSKRVEIPVKTEQSFILWFSFTKIEIIPPNTNRLNAIKNNSINIYIPKC